MSHCASCPGCSKVFRPRSLLENACWDSVTTHISEISRQGCHTHRAIHAALFKRPFGCPGCPEIFGSKIEALQHLASTTDSLHSRFKIRQDDRTVLRAQRHARPAVSAPPRSESELYSAAKSGYLDTVRTLLALGLNPNHGGEDGFTPLMTAAEAGHADVVMLLAQNPQCQINRKNSYGQSALRLAAQNGRVDAVLTLLDSRGLDLEAVSGGATAAQAARRAGHAALADIIAGAAREQQITALLAALTDEASAAAGAFDCLADRIGTLAAAVGAAPPAAPAPAEGGGMVCAVCLDAPVAAALRPCFHAALCAGCADGVVRAGMRCPICRAAVTRSQRIFFS